MGLCTGRSMEMVIGLMAILKAGGAYLPLDPECPLERLAFMLEDTQARVLLTQERFSEGRGSKIEDGNPPSLELLSEKASIPSTESNLELSRRAPNRPRFSTKSDLLGPGLGSHCPRKRGGHTQRSAPRKPRLRSLHFRIHRRTEGCSGGAKIPRKLLRRYRENVCSRTLAISSPWCSRSPSILASR